LLLPVAGEFFPLTLPFIERANRRSGFGQSEPYRFADLPRAEEFVQEIGGEGNQNSQAKCAEKYDSDHRTVSMQRP